MKTLSKKNNLSYRNNLSQFLDNKWDRKLVAREKYKGVYTSYTTSSDHFFVAIINSDVFFAVFPFLFIHTMRGAMRNKEGKGGTKETKERKLRSKKRGRKKFGSGGRE